MPKLLFIISLFFFIVATSGCSSEDKKDFLEKYRDTNGIMNWGNITTSQLSMDFHYTLGTSEEYWKHQDEIRNRNVNGSVYDCEKDWLKYCNQISNTNDTILNDTIAFTQEHKIFNIISKEDYDVYSTYGMLALKDFNLKGDFNDDGYIDQLIFFSFLHHPKGTVFNTLWSSYGETFPWRRYQGFGLVTKYKNDGLLYLIDLRLNLPEQILELNQEISARIEKEENYFKK